MEVAKDLSIKIMQKIDESISDFKSIIEENSDYVSIYTDLKCKIFGQDKLKITSSLQDINDNERYLNLLINADETISLIYFNQDPFYDSEKIVRNLDKETSSFILSVLDITKPVISDKDIIQSIKYICMVQSGIPEEDLVLLKELCNSNYILFKKKCNEMNLNASDLRYIFSNIN